MENGVALVTGASSGIGAATALSLIEKGFAVYGAARRVDAMAPLVAAGGKALPLDLTDEASIEACVRSVLDAAGRIDVLVNNAGYEAAGAVEDIPIAEARRQFEVNLFGLARLVQLVLPGMRSRRSGRIVNISSMGGTIYTPLGAWYHASKHAVEGFSDCLRIELAPHGIDVIVIAPGAIASNFNAVVTEHVLKASGSGPYAPLARSLAARLARSEGSPPSVVADAIVAAATASRPRTRYRPGQYARSMVLARRLLGDRGFDWLIGRMIPQAG
jgi:NAD(P)-dependent dehydrogenase (short-subunit alcohol dehydrogenase family)